MSKPKITSVGSSDEAKAAGFAGFNRNNHICIELPDEAATISVKTADGQKITFAFVKRHDGVGNQCVDIQHHGAVKNEDGTPLQKAIAFGQGPTIFRTDYKDEPPCTLLGVMLPTNEEQEQANS